LKSSHSRALVERESSAFKFITLFTQAHHFALP
jgi:hypothetical protein